MKPSKLVKEDYINGQTILIDKPLGWSSFQALNKVKWALRKKFDLGKRFKIGHAGTLDPLATGLLVLCTGKNTKKIPTIQEQQKEYTGTITLGASTPSYDLETKIDKIYTLSHITREAIQNTTNEFLGESLQEPPIYSAIQKDGKRLYEYARKGEKVSLTKRPIHIYTFEAVAINLPYVEFRVACSKGTYIRSLAHDFGRKLGSGAHLSSLRRTRIGAFHVDNAIDPIAFAENLNNSAIIKDNIASSKF